MPIAPIRAVEQVQEMSTPILQRHHSRLGALETRDGLCHDSRRADAGDGGQEGPVARMRDAEKAIHATPGQEVRDEMLPLHLLKTEACFREVREASRHFQLPRPAILAVEGAVPVHV